VTSGRTLKNIGKRSTNNTIRNHRPTDQKKQRDMENGQFFHKLWQTGVYLKCYQVRNTK